MRVVSHSTEQTWAESHTRNEHIRRGTTGPAWVFGRSKSLYLWCDEMCDIFCPARYGKSWKLYSGKICPQFCLFDFDLNTNFIGINKSPLRVKGRVICSIIYRGQIGDAVIFYAVENFTIKCPAIFGRSFIVPNNLRLMVMSPSDREYFTHDIFNINISDNINQPEYQINLNFTQYEQKL